MLKSLLYGYVVVAVTLFVCLFLFGKICKWDVLGNGVKVGFLNSLLLSSLWPISALVSFAGMCYEAVKTWKKI